MRSVGTWLVVGIVGAAATVLAVVLVSGAGIADEEGRPLDVPAVSVTPGPSSTPSPTADDSPDVVDAPAPVSVDLDDHGGDNGNRGGNDDNSGKGGGDDG